MMVLGGAGVPPREESGMVANPTLEALRFVLDGWWLPKLINFPGQCSQVISEQGWILRVCELWGELGSGTGRSRACVWLRLWCSCVTLGEP